MLKATSLSFRLLRKTWRWLAPLGAGVLIATILMATKTPAKWHIQLLGPLKVQYGDKELAKWRSIRQRALLGYLALASKHDEIRDWPQTRLDLANELWAQGGLSGQRETSFDFDDERLPGYLAAEVTHLTNAIRSAFGGDSSILVRDNGSLKLHDTLIETDVNQFLNALEDAKHARSASARSTDLQAAVTIYEGGGDLLPGIETPRIQTLRESLRVAYIRAKDDLEKLNGARGRRDIDERMEFVAQQNIALHHDLVNQLRNTRGLPGEEAWVERLDAQQLECLASIAREIAQEHPPTLIATDALPYVWGLHHNGREMRNWLVRRLKKPGGVSEVAKPYVYRTIGRLSMGIGERDLGLKYTLAGLKLFKERENREEVAKAFTYLGWIYEDRKDYASAVRSTLEAMRLREETGQSRTTNYVRLTHAAGEQLLLAGKPEKAVAFVDEAISLAGEIGNEQLASYARVTLARIRFKLGEALKAEENLNEAQAYAQTIRDTGLELHTQTWRGLLLFEKKRYQTCLPVFSGCIRLAMQRKEHPDLESPLRHYLLSATHLLHKQAPHSSATKQEAKRLAHLLGVHDRLVEQSDAVKFDFVEADTQKTNRALSSILGAEAVQRARKSANFEQLPLLLSSL